MKVKLIAVALLYFTLGTIDTQAQTKQTEKK